MLNNTFKIFTSNKPYTYMAFSITRINRLLLIGLFFLPINTIAQVAIEGRVVSESSGLPLEGASVYFNNTFIGTSTNDPRRIWTMQN